MLVTTPTVTPFPEEMFTFDSSNTSPTMHRFASVCKYKLCKHDLSKNILAPDLEGVYAILPLFAAKTIWISVETTSYLENKAVRRKGTHIFCSPVKNWSRQVLWLFGLDTFDFQWIFACYCWRVTRAGSFHALGAWVYCCSCIAWVDCCLMSRGHQLVVLL
jgi:hypothetical protein